MTDYKTVYLDQFFEHFKGRQINVIDMGAGTSKDWVSILAKYKNINYTGLEFNKDSINEAKKLLGFSSNVSFINDFGENVLKSFENHFDVVISLSVLEHVKYLDDFLLASIRITKSGGHIVHRYDLGHALHSSSVSEKIKVFLCKHIPILISAKKFTTHPDKEKIIALLNNNNVSTVNVEQHQVPNFKKLMNILKHNSDLEHLIIDMIEIEEKLYKALKGMSNNSQLIDYYFPCVTIKGIKN